MDTTQTTQTQTDNSKAAAPAKTAANVKQMALIALMAAVICILAPWSFTIPISIVPLTLGSMAVYFAVTVLGMKRGVFSVLLYILIGLVGLPVFSNFTGGAGKLFGPTGGYIIGYIFLALILGYFVDRWNSHPVWNAAGAILGTIVLYLFGTVWLALQMHLTFKAALWAGVIPYIPGDVVKLIIATVLGITLRKRLIQARAIAK